MSGYVKTFKVKVRGKYKNKKFMSFHVDDGNLLEKYNAIWTKIENLKMLNYVLYKSMMIEI